MGNSSESVLAAFKLGLKLPWIRNLLTLFGSHPVIDSFHADQDANFLLNVSLETLHAAINDLLKSLPGLRTAVTAPSFDEAKSAVDKLLAATSTNFRTAPLFQVRFEGRRESRAPISIDEIIFDSWSSANPVQTNTSPKLSKASSFLDDFEQASSQIVVCLKTSSDAIDRWFKLGNAISEYQTELDRIGTHLLPESLPLPSGIVDAAERIPSTYHSEVPVIRRLTQFNPLEAISFIEQVLVIRLGKRSPALSLMGGVAELSHRVCGDLGEGAMPPFLGIQLDENSRTARRQVPGGGLMTTQLSPLMWGVFKALVEHRGTILRNDELPGDGGLLSANGGDPLADNRRIDKIYAQLRSEIKELNVGIKSLPRGGRFLFELQTPDTSDVTATQSD